ncbi:dATP/dGTP diphosphohydrolase domain-containing protein [Pannonibacter sp. SL95]|uniref:dATP/dGTP diphosphohydrolase domain-containing protein n=1 Tax=Pannonibacter sp. SL95 TaxID=2995153 RepID=UPI00227489A6|nr:dATP/dGTP diphosphohydrolase domain-containing protein [Pannonibacter sp. SL95]MCY1708375.1 DUF5664 domain-containing protein [Pannonibacter sp. SL95]
MASITCPHTDSPCKQRCTEETRRRTKGETPRISITEGENRRILARISRRSEQKPAPNPKQAFGDKKPALGQTPLVGRIHQSLAHMDGDYKYGFRNWRENPVEALTYVHAAMRHLELWAEGQEHTLDTGVHNLGAVMACCAILLDAQANGTIIDNRSKSEAACQVLADAEAVVRRLQEAQAARQKEKHEEDLSGRTDDRRAVL